MDGSRDLELERRRTWGKAWRARRLREGRPVKNMSGAGRGSNLRVHGGYRAAEYGHWRNIITRCCDSRNKHYAAYGARGILICDRWKIGTGTMHGFECFVADMGRRPSPKHSIDRIDNDGNYEPGNCRWATNKEQSLNRRTNNLLTARGETLPLGVWAERAGVNRTTIKTRLNAGWSTEEAIFTPAFVGANGTKNGRAA